MPRRKLPYIEGDWFAVPLPTGGYGLGIVARADRQGGILGYLFGPRHPNLPTKEDIIGLSANDAVLIRRFGDLGLLNGEWQIIYRPDTWHREEWPLPAFARIARDRSRALRVEYTEDAGETESETPISVEEAMSLPEAGLSGYGALETRLDILLTKLEGQTT